MVSKNTSLSWKIRKIIVRYMNKEYFTITKFLWTNKLFVYTFYQRNF